MNKIDFKHLNRLPYNQALNLMLDLRSKRQKNLIPDTILFLEHEAVITSGRREASDDLKITPSELSKKGVSFIQTDRGGKLTYHGPGQLVVYFVVNIVERKLSVDQLVTKTMGVVQDYLKDEGVQAEYQQENPGLWVGTQKIASVGFHIQKGITTHGLSFNVNNELGIYDCFIPCGLSGRGVTNLSLLTGRTYDLNQIALKLQEKLTRSCL